MHVQELFESEKIAYTLPPEIDGVDFVGDFDPETKTAYIGSIVSSQAGSGRQAVQAFEKWAREMGALSIRGEATPASIIFWNKMGFRDRNRGERLIPIWKMLTS